jgi:hypothetical protein
MVRNSAAGAAASGAAPMIAGAAIGTFGNEDESGYLNRSQL